MIVGTEIFHIARRQDWEAAEEVGEHRVSTLGRSLNDVGFIHCSASRAQVLTVADKVYADLSEPLVLLVIDVDEVGSDVRYELAPGRPDPFPHIYGPLPVDAVTGVVDLDRDADGAFMWPRGLA
jgi:uncharacterized protein (DUF952 family)